jgi:hypothetical protein
MLPETILLISASINILFLILLFISVRINYKLGVTILNVEDAIESSLDVLDKRYNSMSKILEIPVFFDSVEVRQVISDIEGSKETILDIANTLTRVDGNNIN